MFKLKNVEGSIELNLEIIGYQFPENKKDDWCLLKIIVNQGSGHCELIDPAIETTEAIQLLHWFSSLSEGRLPRYSHLTFIEPCISFEFLAFKDGVVRMAINLSHELKPPFDIEQFREKNNDWSIVFELRGSNFTDIRNGIKNSLEMYPVRGS